MRNNLGKPLIILAILGSFLVGFHKADASDDSSEVSRNLIEAFGTWTDAFDMENGIDPSWEFPFGAPRPANLNSNDLKTVLSLRRFAVNGELGSLESLVDLVERRQDEIPVQMRFWLAYGQNLLLKEQSCLISLQLLLAVPDGWEPLENGQQAWVLTRTADSLFILGQRELASELYARLAVSPREQLNLWGTYQLAGLNFLNRNFEEAGRMYRVICAADKPVPWNEHACAMVEIAGRLTLLGKEGSQHGDVASTTP